jgi:hypothetical protein
VIKSVRIEMDGVCGMYRQRRERLAGLWLEKGQLGRPKPRLEDKLNRIIKKDTTAWTRLA